jgi:hypothetical protein
MWRLPFFEALGDARRVLIAGAGGDRARFRDEITARPRAPFPH